MKQDYTIPRGALDGVEAFVRVAERRSFRQAAVDLGVTPSAYAAAVLLSSAKKTRPPKRGSGAPARQRH